MTMPVSAKVRGALSAPLRRRCLIAGLMITATIGGTASVCAADLIRVGKASATTFAFAPIEIGKEKGIWARYGLEVESIGFGGDARLQQAMVANSIDFALGSGPGMGFLAKGVPSITVAALANEPLAMGLTVGKDSPIRKYEDLKGASISVSTGGSLTLWLAREFSRRMGWGPAGIKTVPLGVNQAQVAALRAGRRMPHRISPVQRPSSARSRTTPRPRRPSPAPVLLRRVTPSRPPRLRLGGSQR